MRRARKNRFWVEGATPGKEAEELRSGIETIIEKYQSPRYSGCQDDTVDDVVEDLRKLIEGVDARDSVQYLEEKVQGRKDG